ncbi:NINE protein [Planktothrix sp. FACHB-1365]|uniref:NINE protein n=1 Tax=Planktothrix sp. FACHB-1365 TaxID=2692855 RepID=UPI0016888D29|nr:NINE protein [Planktothrix sp. FACHB-1365]MBD2482863.1 NINE protein [Planktothrix sp. FACHB-1365]
MKNKIVAALLAFFLGIFGVHKFYLGENLGGVVYLLFSWTFIPGFLAFFDFLGLLLMSDQAFNAKFNPGIPYSVLDGSRSAQDITVALAQLKKLYDQDAITAEEYEEKRRKLLNEL